MSSQFRIRSRVHQGAEECWVGHGPWSGVLYIGVVTLRVIPVASAEGANTTTAEFLFAAQIAWLEMFKIQNPWQPINTDSILLRTGAACAVTMGICMLVILRHSYWSVLSSRNTPRECSALVAMHTQISLNNCPDRAFIESQPGRFGHTSEVVLVHNVLRNSLVTTVWLSARNSNNTLEIILTLV